MFLGVGLTEKGAGVLSGLVVNTTATFRPASTATSSKTLNPAGFVLHSPTTASHKTWISQGLTAQWGVVIARLILPGGVDKGPHAFVVDMNTDGVVKEDMPQKTDFNGLDNANIWFNSVHVPLDGLLRGISSVTPSGEYELVNADVPFRFVSVAQRLLSGRICIAGAAVSQLRKVFREVRCAALLLPCIARVLLSLLPCCIPSGSLEYNFSASCHRYMGCRRFKTSRCIVSIFVAGRILCEISNGLDSFCVAG